MHTGTSTLIPPALILLLTASHVGAQPKKDPTLDTRYLRDHAQTRGFMLGRPVKPLPTPDGKAVLFLRSQPRSAKLSLFEFDVAGKKTRELLTPEQVLKGAEEKLSPEEKAQRERMRVSLGGFTGFQLSSDGTLILLSLSGRLYIYDRTSSVITELKTGPGPLLDPQFSPDGNKIAYVRDHDLHVFDLAHLKETRLTTGGTAQVSHGLAEFIAQEEMGRFTGYWWSPDSRQLLYQETDNREVETWHVADPIHPGQKPTPFFYPRPGKNNAKIRLGVIAVEGGATTWLKWDSEKYPYMTTARWAKGEHSPSPPLAKGGDSGTPPLGKGGMGGMPLVCVQTRDQREIVVLQADPRTGKTEPLLSERDAAWVNIHHGVPRRLEGGAFLWVSERDGGPQLELRGPNGRLRRVVVPARDGFLSIVSVHGDSLIYSASPDPTQAHLFKVSLQGWADPVQLTKDTGLHSAVFAKNHAIYVRTARLLNAMPVSTVHKADGTLIAELPSVAEKEPFDPRVELVQVGKGKEFRAAVIWPRNFEPRKRYPVLVDVYGGPHHLHVAASKGRWLLDQWYADQGFIVVALDGRGTPGRGRDWERAIFKQFGSLPLEDQVAGLEALCEKYPAMDRKRVGIDGWSFGGYMAALAVLRRPDVFHAAVAGAPVVDWLDYDTHYTERYLGIPPKDEESYKDASLLTHAADLKRPLLILHGTADDNVYFRHSLKLVDALFRNGKDFELLPLSGLTHMVPDPLVIERLHARIAGFLQRHLGRPEDWK